MAISATERTPLLSGHDDRISSCQDNGTGARASGTADPIDDGQRGSRLSSRMDDIPMPPYRLLIPLCITVWVPVFVAALDSTIVATLVGAVSSSFNRSEQAAWLGTSYLLSVCCFTPIYGRLCDIMGRKATILFALITFSAGTLLCGVAPSMEALIAARIIAGIGGGGLPTCTSTILSDVVPLRHRGLYQGLTNIVYGLGNGLGGPIGGALNDSLGWRNAFLIQMPFLAVAMILCLCFVHSAPPSHTSAKPCNSGSSSPALPIASETSRMQRFKSIDFLGSLTLVGCVAPVLLSLSFMAAQDVGFREPLVWGNFIAGSLSGVAFVFIETRIARNPILPIHLFTQRTGGNAAMANFFLSVVTHATIYNYPIMFQTTRLQSPSLAGLHLVPNSVALSIGSVFAGIWMRKTGRYYWVNFFHANCMVVSAVMIMCLTPNAPDWLTYVAIIPHGFGCAGVLTCTLLALINSVPRAEIAVATGMSYLFRTTGQVVGVAASGVILQGMLKRELWRRIDDAKLIEKIRHQLSIIDELPHKQQASVIAAYDVSLRVVFAFVLLAAIGTAITSFSLEDHPLPDAAPAPKPSDDAEQQE